MPAGTTIAIGPRYSLVLRVGSAELRLWQTVPHSTVMLVRPRSWARFRFCFQARSVYLYGFCRDGAVHRGAFQPRLSMCTCARQLALGFPVRVGEDHLGTGIATSAC